MADSTSISYKVYLDDGTDTGEVRRFGIDRSLAFKFSFLKEKLQKVFPSLQNRNFYVSWKDQEGDIIMISSDEELTVALSEMNTDLRKLYVALKPEENLVPDAEMPEVGQPVEGPAVHEGVTCDGCNKPIVGFRYKCAVCPDFDLCAACEGFGMHDEHFMIRISKPIKWRSAYSRRLAHHMAKWSRLSETHRHHHQRRTSNVKCPAGQPGNERSGQCQYSRSYSEHPGWLEYLCSQLGEWVNLPGEVEIPPKGGNAATAPENTAVPGAAPKPSTSSAAESAKGPQETPSGNSNQPRDVTYLQNVGETVAALLSPLGIDVEIHVKDKNQKQAEEKQDPPQASAQSKEMENSAQVKETEKTAPTKEAVKTVHSGEAGMAAAASASEPMEVSPDLPSAPSQAPPERRNSLEPEDWTVLLPDNLLKNATPSKIVDEFLEKFDEPAYRAIYPTVEDVIARTRELELEQEPITDPKVAKTLSQLLAMGFTNEGAWLTQLVKIKDGNIDRVLDVLLPKK